MVACEGEVRGTCAKAREKTLAWPASLSRFGVRPRLDPRKPIRSARVVSSVIRMMLGWEETTVFAGTGFAAQARPTSKNHGKIRFINSTLNRQFTSFTNIVSLLGLTATYHVAYASPNFH